MTGRRVGTTSEEIEKQLNMRHQNVSARRTELRANGYTDYVFQGNARVRRPTTSGRGAFVEIATKKGKDAIKFDTPLKINGRDYMRHGGNAASRDAFESSNFQASARAVLKVMCQFSP